MIEQLNERDSRFEIKFVRSNANGMFCVLIKVYNKIELDNLSFAISLANFVNHNLHYENIIDV